MCPNLSKLLYKTFDRKYFSLVAREKPEKLCEYLTIAPDPSEYIIHK